MQNLKNIFFSKSQLGFYIIIFIRNIKLKIVIKIFNRFSEKIGMKTILIERILIDKISSKKNYKITILAKKTNNILYIYPKKLKIIISN